MQKRKNLVLDTSNAKRNDISLLMWHGTCNTPVELKIGPGGKPK